MGQMTAGQVLAQVDDLLPNSYPGEQKRRWLRQAEGFVLEEVVRVHEGGQGAVLPGELTDAAELLADLQSRNERMFLLTFTVINIAYMIFLAVVVLVNMGMIHVEYVRTLVEYLQVTDYVILYAILIVMGYLISGKFARSLFKKTAMGSFREEE